MTDFIWITTQFEAIHRYPKAPKGVEFLKNEHRHIFHVKVWIEVHHDDRDIEFILFKRYIDLIIKKGNLSFMSCEMIANALYKKINKKYPFRDVKIEISEDKENGCLMEYLE